MEQKLTFTNSILTLNQAIKIKTKLSDVMARYSGVGPSFDIIRLGLAIVILFGHTRNLIFSGAESPSAAAQLNFDIGNNLNALVPDSIFSYIMQIESRIYVLYVPMFFVLSGFLVAGSALRLKNIRVFLIHRGLRIFPALTFEVFLSAIILGMFFSKLPVRDYVRDPQFLRYFGNIFGFVTFTLPGVFEENPLPNIVNVNLWTLPAEFYCYLTFSIAMAIGLPYYVGRTLIFIVVTYVALSIAAVLWGFGVAPSVYSNLAITYYFAVGVAFFVLKSYIPYHFTVFLFSAIAVALATPFPNLSFVIAPLLAYLTIYIGFLPKLALPFLKGNDYSYGIYLYGFPISQGIVSIFPKISRMELFLLALSMTLAVAICSWHWIEKPCLKLKKRLTNSKSATVMEIKTAQDKN